MTRTRVPSLRTKNRPRLAKSGAAIRVVDLFAGCGGLSLGVQQAATAAGLRVEVPLAVDFEASAVAVYAANFPDAHVVEASVEEHFDGALGAELTTTETGLRSEISDVHLLMGGPPCQGHSNLNNVTRRNDPKNELYARMGRAAEVLTPNFVLIENVPSVRLDTDGVVQTTVAHLEAIGYDVATATIRLHTLGVAQKRQRHVLLASRVRDVDPAEILRQLTSRTADAKFDLRWAIGDLVDVAEPTAYDLAPVASADNRARMQYLLDRDLYDLPNDQRPVCHRDQHSYKSMYGRLNWSGQAQTITSGFGSIGQGRYMHPDLPRALTAHEAARIQGFPDYFSFSAITRRGSIATMIGNAVPPALTRELVAYLLPGFDIDADDAADSADAGQATSAPELQPVVVD